MIYIALRHIHSGIRWILLFILIWSIINSLMKLAGKKEFSMFDQKLGAYTVMWAHIQLLFGIVLYFISPKVVFQASSMKNQLLRFYLIEHIGIMIIAVILITMGYIKAKKAANTTKKFRLFAIYDIIALIFILLAIPWPWRGFGSGWL